MMAKECVLVVEELGAAEGGGEVRIRSPKA